MSGSSSSQSSAEERDAAQRCHDELRAGVGAYVRARAVSRAALTTKPTAAASKKSAGDSAAATGAEGESLVDLHSLYETFGDYLLQFASNP